ncbi:MAG: GrdX family protein [Firmicutes bacterium]|nr:GrdX family protein [Bacillota bacterium]MBR5980857.1 GrdX family protein [Bacillota bacterium]
MTLMKASIFSNNVDIEDLVPSAFSFYLLPDAPARDVLTAARDRIHLGAKLLAHPMAGRLRPNETPYRTVVLEEGGEGALDLPSFGIIEYCLAEEDKYAAMRRKYDEALLPDLRFIDCEIFQSVLKELGL